MTNEEYEKITKELRESRKRLEQQHWTPELFGLPARAITTASTNFIPLIPKFEILDLTVEDIKMLKGMGIQP